MPLVEVHGPLAEVICLGCGVERTIPPTEWRTTEDTSALGTPPCPTCGAAEWFSWHDWCYVDENGEPRPEHHGARQMVLIAALAGAHGRSRRTVDNTGRKYRQTPRAHTPDEVRAYAEHIRAAT